MMSTPQMDKTQRNMMLLLPLFFVIIMINFPAGVLVYWITTNLWTILQQYFVRRQLGPMTPLAAAEGDGGPPTGRGGGGEPDAGGNGAQGGGLPGLLRGLTRGDKEPEPAATGARTRTPSGPPPPPPRKRKKRSGRRR
jgi:YidC/Oxa1 family membrane protein insertase